jgi:hypothetical protein
VSQRARKRVEEIFGWLKTVGMMRKVRHPTTRVQYLHSARPSASAGDPRVTGILGNGLRVGERLLCQVSRIPSAQVQTSASRTLAPLALVLDGSPGHTRSRAQPHQSNKPACEPMPTPALCSVSSRLVAR